MKRSRQDIEISEKSGHTKRVKYQISVSDETLSYWQEQMLPQRILPQPYPFGPLYINGERIL